MKNKSRFTDVVIARSMKLEINHLLRNDRYSSSSKQAILFLIAHSSINEIKRNDKGKMYAGDKTNIR